MKNKKGTILLFTIAGLTIVIIFGYFLLQYIEKEKKSYADYNDFERASIIMYLHAVNKFEDKYDSIRFQQRLTPQIKVSKEELFDDYLSYDFIPILNYVKSKDDYPKLYDAFSPILEFATDYQAKITKDFTNEMIFVSQQNGKYFQSEDHIFYYHVKKIMVTKEGFQTLYRQYIGQETLVEHIVKLLLKDKDIAQEYHKKDLQKKIATEYDKFYRMHQSIMIDMISKDLNDFAKYLNHHKDLESIPHEIINLTYPIIPFERIEYNFFNTSKYANWIYQLDLKNVWQQLQAYGYPKLYV